MFTADKCGPPCLQSQWMEKVGRWSGGSWVSRDSSVSAVSVMEDELFKRHSARSSDWTAISEMSGMCCMWHPKSKGGVIVRCSSCKTACRLFNDKLSVWPWERKRVGESLRPTLLNTRNAYDKPATSLRPYAICRRNCAACWRWSCLCTQGY